MIRFINALGLLTLAYSGLVLADVSDSSKLISVPFEALEKGSFHGADTSRYQPVIELHTGQDLVVNWQEFLSAGLPISKDPPKVDFSNWFVIAVFDKSKLGSCYRFKVNEVYLTSGSPDKGASISLDYLILGAGYGCLAHVPKHFEIIKAKRLK